MDTKEKILALVKEKKGLSGVQLSVVLGISRQAVNKHLKPLLQNGSLIKTGVTRGAIYKIATAGKKPKTTFKKSTLSFRKIADRSSKGVDRKPIPTFLQ